MEFDLDIDNQTEDNKLEKVLRKFNWGAFLFSWLWGLSNGVYNAATYIALVVFAIWLLGWFVFSFLFIYFSKIFFVFAVIWAVMFGVRGNTWAWESDYKNWKSLEHFTSVQKQWGVAAFVILILSVIFIGAPLIIGASFVSKVISPSGRGEVILKPVVLQLVKAKEYPSLKNGSDVAKYVLNDAYLAGSFNDATTYGVSGVKLSSTTKKGNNYSIAFTFYKEETCNLDKKNCYIYYYDDADGTGNLKASAKVYYDDNGKYKIVQIKDKK